MKLLIGNLAAICTTLSFFPQALKIIKTKETKNISLPTYLIFTVGVVFWAIYGVMLGEWPIIAANVVTFVPAFTIVIMKIKYH